MLENTFKFEAGLNQFFQWLNYSRILTKKYKVGYFFEELFNMTFALVLLVISIPFFLVIFLIIKLDDASAPVFYKGKRLGKNKKEFRIFKFRTLKDNTESQIANNLLPKNSSLITLPGRFLRSTRLDELPQLINILKGEMNLVGPRPMRPIMFERYKVEIKAFDERIFKVKPGIFGISQFFTPYHTPPVIRHRIDTRYIKAKSIKYDLKLAVYIIFRMIAVFLKICTRNVKDRLLSGNKTIQEDKRQCRRVKISGNAIFVAPDGNININSGPNVNDISDTSLALLGSHSMKLGEKYCLKLFLDNERGKKKDTKMVLLNLVGVVISSRKNNYQSPRENYLSLYLNVIQFEHMSCFNYYKLEKYILGNSLDLN